MEAKKIVPDTTVLVDGLLSKQLAAGSLKAEAIIISESVLAIFEHLSRQEKVVGLLGLDELVRLRQHTELTFAGKRPSAFEVERLTIADADALTRQLAFDEGATLVTASKLQARLAKVMDLKVIELTPAKRSQMRLETFFDETTMSVHLRENLIPYAKKGMPGDWKFVELSQAKLAREDIQAISTEIIEESAVRKDGFIEIERPGSTIVQLGRYRIVITKPPFSDGWEITAVRPVKKLSLDDYHLSERLAQRIKEQADGILIAGAPGMGKSTFASALAEFYADQGRIVKTIEAPRDLVLGDNVTQYAISHADAQEVHDVLLLSRPDNTLFDEMRNTSDFQLFADLRLAGIGLAGVVHATNPIDAIQRFVGRIELGVIPQVIDTVIFIKNGTVYKVLSLQMVVKVPAGMTEADLARPVVVVTDFESKKPEYELYSYGEETVVVPVRKGDTPAMHQLAAKSIEDEVRAISRDATVEVVSDNKCIVYVPKDDMARMIGKQGSTVTALERKLGLSIDVQEQKAKSSKEPIQFDKQITKNAVEFFLNTKHKTKDVDIYVQGDYLLSAKVGKSGVIKIAKAHGLGKVLVQAINAGEKVEIFL